MSIEARIAQLLDSFSAGAEGLFTITGRYQTPYEHGIYGCALAKPTKRMRNALGVDREILVVASTFSDQQQRAIRFVKKEIESSAGRYENTIAIIIHNDPDGNFKLKNWGTEQGISILPLYEISRLTSPGELERTLSMELYSHDPFDVRGPVSDDANFYGRREQAIDLARKLQTGQIRSCLGIRRAGKTSIINRVLREIRSNYQCTCVMVDCSRDDVSKLNAAQLLNSLRQTIDHALRSPGEYATIAPTDSPVDLTSARNSLESAVLGCEHPLLFIFDEVDYITPGSPTGEAWRSEFNPFWRNLRSIYQECGRQGHTMSILVGGVSTFWFTVESIDGIENAALSFIPEEYLSPMPEFSTVAMLRRLGRIAGLKLDGGALELVARASGNMPYWARQCCSYVHRHVPITKRPCAVNAQQMEPLINAFVAEEGAAISEVALRHLFRVHPRLQEATQKCYSGDGEKVSEPLRRALRRYGVLSAKDELSGAMLSQGFVSLISETGDSVNSTHAAKPGETGFGLSEWAEELAALGRRRNVLERRFRELAINFIRFDALSSGKQIDVKTRITSTLSESRRHLLLHLSAEEAVSRLFWKELSTLIAKEWSLFGRLFGDKQQFLQCCDLINDRFDAHAKSADQADFALYRRALSQLEERVAKIQ